MRIELYRKSDMQLIKTFRTIEEAHKWAEVSMQDIVDSLDGYEDGEEVFVWKYFVGAEI